MRCTESARRVIAASDISGQLAFDTEAWRPAAPPCARGMETNFVVPACKQWALVQQLCRHNAPTLLLNPQPSPFRVQGYSLTSQFLYRGVADFSTLAAGQACQAWDPITRSGEHSLMQPLAPGVSCWLHIICHPFQSICGHCACAVFMHCTIKGS